MAQGKPDAPAYKRLSQVTRPVLKLPADKAVHVKITAPIRQGVGSGKVDASGQQQKPADVLECIDLPTGEEVQIVVPAVLKGNLLTHYPDNGYVGKGFEIVRHAPANGKRYSTFDVWEIEVK